MAFIGYCTVEQVKGATIDRAIADANISDAEIQFRIDEGWQRIESGIIPLGYSRAQLQLCPMISQVNILLARYAILRDIFQNIAPSESGEPGFNKWNIMALEIIKKIIEGVYTLTDAEGELISPARANKKLEVSITSKETGRMITLESPENWKIPASYTDEALVGKTD